MLNKKKKNYEPFEIKEIKVNEFLYSNKIFSWTL